MTKKIFLLLLLLAMLTASVFADKRAFTIEDLYRIKALADIQFSPDGKTILYSVGVTDLPRAKRAASVWLMDADGKNAHQIIASGAFSPAFTPDGKWISFLSAKDGHVNLWAMPVTGGEWKQLTKLSTGVADVVWSNDGKMAAFASDVFPECNGDDACNKRIAERWEKGPLRAHLADSLLYRHWTDWKDGKRTHVFVANIETGAVRDVTPGDFDAPPFQLGGPVQYGFSPDGKELVYVSNHDPHPESSTNNDLWLLSLTDPNAKPRNITAANLSYDGSPKYSPDGRYIAYRMQKIPGYESDLFRLALYDRATGKSEVLTESYRNWVEDYEWASDAKSLYFTGPLKGEQPIHKVDIATKKISLLVRDKTIDAFAISEDNRHLIYLRRSTGDPVELFSVNIEGDKTSAPTKLTNLNEAIASEVDIRPAEQLWITGAGGAKIQTFIVKPHNFDPNKKYPLILNVHGGPQSQWSDALRGDWQIYPGAGYVVAFCNPHGSTGYGQDFTAEISGDWAGMVFEDLMKVSDELEKLPYVDKNRMGAMGWSYGGYMMDWFEGHTTRFKAIASMMGLYDLSSFYGATEELWFPEWDLKGQPWNSKLYETLSPSSYAKNFKTPCLVISGERDYRVPYTQALHFYTDLQKMKVPSRLLIYANAGHWPSAYEMALYYTAHLEWFHKYLGGDAPPWTTEQFVRNGVFDRETGKRFDDAANAKSATLRPNQEK
ncbi:MAG: S9 family peptidase [Acidobacteria bacterium]|nr:S9 family peptidase [Acidobacteriota bacterium]